MVGTLRRVKVAMWLTYLWVPMNVPLYLVLDNAEGHGAKKCIAGYSTTLKNDHNIECVHQSPRSPSTNVLDLDVCPSLQSGDEQCYH